MAYRGFSNLTPFAADPFFLMDSRGAEVITFIVKGSYDLLEGGATVISESQAPIQVAAEHYGAPDTSSIKYDSEVAYTKNGTDCILIGHAQVPGKVVTSVEVIFKAAGMVKAVRVSGDRCWKNRLGLWRATPPLPFEKMPLVYELAYGGWDTSHQNKAFHGFCAHNPAGIGYIASKSRKEIEGARLPNLEDPRAPLKDPKSETVPAGFGYIAPNWRPRLHYAGTYDEAWLNGRMPSLPDDFDIRFYNAASPGLTSPDHLKGGEPVEIINASTRGRLRFDLPQDKLRAAVKMKTGGLLRRDLNLDTVIVNTDEDRLYLIWRACLDLQQRIHDILWTKTELCTH